MTVLVDSHCHLDFPDFAEERDTIVAHAREALRFDTIKIVGGGLLLAFLSGMAPLFVGLPFMTALWTEACLAFPALDAMREGFEVYVVADAVGGTSVGAHEAALRRIEQAGGQLISKTQLYCELQRDWAREATVPGFMDVFENWDGFNPEKAFKG